VYGRKGKLWTHGGLSKLIHAEVYKGVHTFHAKSGPVVCPVPALVTPELWDAAHAQLDRNSTQRETRRESLLRGKIRCLNCGGSYSGSTRHKRSEVYYRCVSTLKLTARRCSSINLNASYIEGYVWEKCLSLLEDPGQVFSGFVDELERLERLDRDRVGEVQRLQKALAEQESARQRVIGHVRKGNIEERDADEAFTEINAEVGRLHAELTALDTTKSLSRALMERIKAAEATLKDLREKTNLDDPADRRRAVEALLGGITVKTIGEGRERRAELSFNWLSHESYTLLDTEDLDNKGIKRSRLGNVLIGVPNSPASWRGHKPT
jgi:hypothetical protein